MNSWAPLCRRLAPVRPPAAAGPHHAWLGSGAASACSLKPALLRPLGLWAMMTAPAAAANQLLQVLHVLVCNSVPPCPSVHGVVEFLSSVFNAFFDTSARVLSLPPTPPPPSAPKHTLRHPSLPHLQQPATFQTSQNGSASSPQA